jgi:hypothetical protein
LSGYAGQYLSANVGASSATVSEQKECELLKPVQLGSVNDRPAPTFCCYQFGACKHVEMSRQGILGDGYQSGQLTRSNTIRLMFDKQSKRF